MVKTVAIRTDSRAPGTPPSLWALARCAPSAESGGEGPTLRAQTRGFPMSAQASATHPVKPAGTMNPGHWVLLVLGVVLAAVGGGLTAGGSVLLGGAAAQHDGGYVLSGTERLRTTGYALTSPSARIDLGGTGAAGAPGMPALGDLAGVEVRAASAVPGQAIFVGIADSSKVSDYLRDVPSASVGNVSWSIDGLRPGNRVPSGSRANAGEIQPSRGTAPPPPPRRRASGPSRPPGRGRSLSRSTSRRAAGASW
ncbi:hypothetical protein SCMU_02650 [Sinomonas cyclohexanicum]|uniref:Uncharacterized protein n=2 Tax=Sinomonas cyclohexanicum TaxID=322009 RepID=A0ABN6FF29_SINCY|nr:hypothetical protein SCMU_02650 [Corynebacterium cyclohexanicum]